MVGLRAFNLAVQVVALECDGFNTVEQQTMHMATAVSEPFGARAVGARGRAAVAQHVVFVLPDGGVFGVGQLVALVFADELTCEAACDGWGFGQTFSLVFTDVGLLREPNLRLSRVTGYGWGVLRVARVRFMG